MQKPIYKTTCVPLAILTVFFAGLLSAQEPVEFDTGRPRPPKNGLPVLGSGLAMSKGYYRGVPVGELAGWTMTLWFEARSNKKGELFGIVRNEVKGEAFRLAYENGSLTFGGDDKRKKSWKLEANGIIPEKWHQVVISYAQATGPALYVDGKHVAQGQRGQMGYATNFDHYHFGASLLGKDKFGDYFDGLLDDFTLHSRPFSAEEIERVYEGEIINNSQVAFNDFENVNHRDFALFTESDRDESYLDEGKKLYELNCIACHSKDGVMPPPNPLSRIFTRHKMENGGDPFSMFQTLTYGFRNMMPAVQLNPEDRYKVIHYLRERMIREKAAELYVGVNETYADTMPRSPKSSGEAAMRTEALARIGYLRDYGRALISPVVGKASSLNALTIDLGSETTISYDLGTMRSIGAWTGGFLDFSNTLHHRLRAGGLPSARFDMIPGVDGWRWAWDGKAENEIPDLGPLTVWPEDQLRYRGHYPNGEDIVVSYTVQGRGVLESPIINDEFYLSGICRRLTVEPGEKPLELVVLSIDGGNPVIDGNKAHIDAKERRISARLWVQGSEGIISDEPPEEPSWRTSKDGELVLQIPASKEPLNLSVVIGIEKAGTSNKWGPPVPIVDLSSKTKGGSRRWTATQKVKGKLATSTFQGYAMDSLSVPLKNAYNSWMRTSSLAFFPDGRLAVGTLAGDVWIVSGINENLGELTWQRFAAGLYEPLGMKVVDGVLTVGTRGRIVKLHDYNNDGEADFYEAFHNEREPSAGWHAYNCDLEVGDDGSYYYGRTGGFSKWSVPGGIVRVSPDGKNSEVIGKGLRVPNGIGKLPDGRITLGDNQGTYVPASKIAITSPGAFHGAGKWTDREGNYDPEKIVQPIVYMPQELDSSSGGQLWVEKDERLGPLSGQYFHTSYGKAATMYVMLDDLGHTMQGAVFSLPLKMESGTLRVAKNPLDGLLYYSGLTGWQAGATRDGSIQRLRHTGEKGIYLQNAIARKGRLELTFNTPVKEVSEEGWEATAWNYRWSKEYGSPHLKVSEPRVEGVDTFRIKKLDRTNDGKKIIVHIPDLQPCHTLKLNFSVKGADATNLSGPVYFTIHELP